MTTTHPGCHHANAMPPQPAPKSKDTEFYAPTKLRDGSRVQIRQIRPSDTKLLLSAFEQLGPESRYRRFLAPLPQLGQTMVHYLTNVDHHDHDAVVALDEQGKHGIGIAR
jgi:hypothetical protein